MKLPNIQTLALVGAQYGDEGKGKLVDYYADWADFIARCTGGANAGHTISINGRTYVFHLIPSGILHDKLNVIGNGVALDPRIISEELEILARSGIDCARRLRIAQNAKLVLPQHLVLDRVRESAMGQGKIGTTGRGIGPVYEDHYRRIGLVVNDLLNLDLFVVKLERNLKEATRVLSLYNPELVKEVLHHPHLENGRFYAKKNLFDRDAIIAEYRRYTTILGEMIEDTDSLLRAAVGKKRILLEGSQGNLLSIDHGTYPFVTVCDCTIDGLVKGAGLDRRDVDRVLGIAKAFYITRVGRGPFPTEIGGDRAATWCGRNDVNKEMEQTEAEACGATLESVDPLLQNIAIRRAGKEYGSTTGRPRRIGWFDLPILRYSRKLTGKHIALTKLDVLNECSRIKICTEYQYGGLIRYRIGKKSIEPGDILYEAVIASEVMNCCTPCYREFPGWKRDICDIRSWKKLPQELKNIVLFIEKAADVTVTLLSVGPDREQTIIRDD